jgi:hypothetical protein
MLLRPILLLGVRAAAICALGGALACTPAAGPEGQPDPSREAIIPLDNQIASSLQAESLADSVGFTLSLTNVSSEPLPLTFPTGQSFDFVVMDGGRELWRWSEGMMFTQAIRQETLSPEETRTFTAWWSPPAGTRGEFTVRGHLTALEHRAEQEIGFRVP